MTNYDAPQAHEDDNARVPTDDVKEMAGVAATATMVETTYSDDLSGYDQLPQTD